MQGNMMTCEMIVNKNTVGNVQLTKPQIFGHINKLAYTYVYYINESYTISKHGNWTTQPQHYKLPGELQKEDLKINISQTLVQVLSNCTQVQGMWTVQLYFE